MSGIIGGAGSKSGVIGTTELDYEEGEWTPAASSGSLQISGISPYTKIGRLVTIRAYVYNFSETGDSSWQVTGLPFVPNNEYLGAGALYQVNVTNDSTISCHLKTVADGNLRGIMSIDAGVWLTLLYSHVGSGHINFSITYMTDS